MDFREEDITKAIPLDEPTPLVRILPEAKLWGAVIEQAIRDLRQKRHCRKASQWLTSASEDIGSFRWIVLHLGASADAVQNDVLKKIADGTIKARIRRR